MVRDNADARREHIDRDEALQPNSLDTAEVLAARERQQHYVAGADGTQQIAKPEGARAPVARPPLDSDDAQSPTEPTD